MFQISKLVFRSSEFHASTFVQNLLLRGSCFVYLLSWHAVSLYIFSFSIFWMSICFFKIYVFLDSKTTSECHFKVQYLFSKCTLLFFLKSIVLFLNQITVCETQFFRNCLAVLDVFGCLCCAHSL